MATHVADRPAPPEPGPSSPDGRHGAGPGGSDTDADAATADAPGDEVLGRVATVVVLSLVFAVAVGPAVDNDLWWHLRSGQWMVQHHRLLGPDPFSHTTAGLTRAPYDWLSQLGLYLTWRAGGLLAVSILTALLAVAGIGLIAVACRARPVVKAAVLVLAGLCSWVFWSPRPQMVTFVGCAGVVAALAAARRGRLNLWWLVPAFALWSNLHLGWFYGLGILWASAIGWAVDRRLGRDHVPAALQRRLVAVSAACSVAVLVQPAGFRLYGLVVTQASVGRGFIEEDQPPGLHYPPAWLFYLMILLVGVVLVKDRRRVTLTEVGLVGATALAGCMVVRLVPLFATVAAPVLCRHAEHLLPARRAATGSEPAARTRSRRAGALVCLLSVVAAVVVAAPKLSDANVQAALARHEPVAAVRWIEEHRPPGRLWNLFDWGGYLIWELRDYPVSMDGRADLHVDGMAAHLAALRGEGWAEQMRRQGDDVALVPTQSPLHRAMHASPDWREGYHDAMASVFVRRVPIG